MPSTRSNTVLALNSGSSSVKFAVYKLADGLAEDRLAKGSIKRVGLENPVLEVQIGSATPSKSPVEAADSVDAVESLLKWIDSTFHEDRIEIVGHRFVHGGPTHRGTERISPELLADLHKLIPLDPTHLPRELAGVEAIATRNPNWRQFACFDTGFHAQLPEVARTYPLPVEVRREGVFKYGFHGLSYQYIMSEVAKENSQIAAKGSIVIAHLGSGSSMAGVQSGVGVDTTMGFTPTGGLMMATRSGDLDPGIFLYLLEQKRMSPPELNDLFNKRSGLLGVSETTSDMAELLAKESSDPKAALAVEMFLYICRKTIGSLAAALGGLDLLVFTGGIGENALRSERGSA